jgi:tRNA pseudouridine55 synthase
VASGQNSTVGDGLIVVDKPAGMTSHDVVGRIRRIVHSRRVGHAGTLDPMATGVLVLGINRATRLLHHLQLADKSYRATMRLGVSTVTDDAEGEVRARTSTADVTEDAVQRAMADWSGAVHQVPAAVSAIKVDGVRSYQRARSGEAVTLAARPVVITRFVATAFRRPVSDLLDVDVEVDCTTGTYVRALARDVGAALGVGGHLTALRRTRVGPFTLDQARSLDELAADADPITLSLAAALRAAFPVRTITPDEADQLSYGRSLSPGGHPSTYAALGDGDEPIALLRDDPDHARPVLVFIARG